MQYDKKVLFPQLDALGSTPGGLELVKTVELFRSADRNKYGTDVRANIEVLRHQAGQALMAVLPETIWNLTYGEVALHSAILTVGVQQDDNDPCKITTISPEEWADNQWVFYRSPWERSPEPGRVPVHETGDLWLQRTADSPWERIQLPVDIVLWGICGALEKRGVTDTMLQYQEQVQTGLYMSKSLTQVTVMPPRVIEEDTQETWVPVRTLERQAWRSRNMSLWTKLTRQTAINRWVRADADSAAHQHGELTLVKSGVSTRTGTRKMYYRYINDMPQPEAIQESPEVYKSIPYVELTDADSGFSLKAFSLPMMIRKLGLIGGHEMFLKVIEVPDNAITNEMVKDIYVEAMLANRGYDLGIRTEKVSVKYHSGLDTDILPHD